jgi:hypothetical protein
MIWNYESYSAAASVSFAPDKVVTAIAIAIMMLIEIGLDPKILSDSVFVFGWKIAGKL